MTPLLTFLNILFLVLTAAYVLRLGCSRRLSERSSLSCLAAVVIIFCFFQSSAAWNLFSGYQARFAIEHMLFVVTWAASAAFVFVCIKLTEFSRIRRTLIQELALLSVEIPAAEDKNKNQLLTGEAQGS